MRTIIAAAFAVAALALPVAAAVTPVVPGLAASSSAPSQMYHGAAPQMYHG